jgi:hypothetical protein
VSVIFAVHVLVGSWMVCDLSLAIITGTQWFCGSAFLFCLFTLALHHVTCCLDEYIKSVEHFSELEAERLA